MKDKKLPTSKREDSKDMISFEPNNTFDCSGASWEDFRIGYNGEEEIYDVINIVCGDFEFLIDKVKGYPPRIRVFNFKDPSITMIFKRRHRGRFKVISQTEALLESL